MKFSIITPLLALAFLAGCGGDEEGKKTTSAPPAGALVADSVRAIESVKDPKGKYKLAIEGSYQTTETATAELKQYSGRPISASIEGAFSDKAFTADVKTTGLDSNLQAKLLVGPQEIFVQFQEQWYGSKEAGINDFLEGYNSAQTTVPTDRKELEADLAKVEVSFDKVMTTTVEDGPDDNGQPTWLIKGKLNPEGIIDLAAAENDPLTAQDEAQLTSVSKDLTVEYVVGKEDKLPRQLVIHLKGDPRTWQLEEQEAQMLSAVDVKLSFSLLGWGTPVEYQAPSDYESIESILQGFGLAPTPSEEMLYQEQPIS